MKEKELKTWEEFEHKCEEIFQHNNRTYQWENIYFRGQSNEDWPLEASLERFSNKEFSFSTYASLIESYIENPVYSYTGRELKEHENHHSRMPPYIEYMVHLRHFGFPTPLLDWTKSPYVALFFAFRDTKDEEIKKGKSVAIYTFQEHRPNEAKGGWSQSPHIQVIGSNLKTNKRHYIQQSIYTYCMREEIYDNDERNYFYCKHTDAQDKQGESDIITKYTLPCSLRNEVLNRLDLMNINAFTLFENEEGLMSTLLNRFRYQGII